MSIKVMSRVWESRLESTEKLITLCLADFSDDDGMNIFPSVAKISIRSSVSDRQTRRILHHLVDTGILEVTGKTASGTMRYRIISDHLASYQPSEDCHGVSPLKTGGTDTMSGGDCHHVRGGLSPCQGGTDTMSGNPLINQELNHYINHQTVDEKFFKKLGDDPEHYPDPEWPPERLWLAILGQLRSDLSKSAFDTWIKSSVPCGWQDDAIFIQVTDPQAEKWLSTRLETTVNRMVSGATNGKIQRVKFVSAEVANGQPQIS